MNIDTVLVRFEMGYELTDMEQDMLKEFSPALYDCYVEDMKEEREHLDFLDQLTTKE